MGEIVFKIGLSTTTLGISFPDVFCFLLAPFRLHDCKLEVASLMQGCPCPRNQGKVRESEKGLKWSREDQGI